MDNFIWAARIEASAPHLYVTSVGPICVCMYMVFTISHLVSLIDKINVLEFLAKEFSLKNILKSVFVGWVPNTLTLLQIVACIVAKFLSQPILSGYILVFMWMLGMRLHIVVIGRLLTSWISYYIFMDIKMPNVSPFVLNAEGTCGFQMILPFWIWVPNVKKCWFQVDFFRTAKYNKQWLCCFQYFHVEFRII